MNFLRTIVFSLVCCLSFSATAKKVNVGFGFYSIKADSPSTSATVPGTSVSLSGPGAYNLLAKFDIAPTLEIGAGYTVFYSKGFSGDMGFGPDISLSWYPVNHGSGVSVSRNSIEYFEIQSFRPYVGMAFHHRQFQSVESSYSGFGFETGLEIQKDIESAYVAAIRSISLIGPSKAKFQYMDFVLSYQFQFK